ncbi:MAG: TM0106 family RecB-like putative nuclease [Gammaproteobacteria bacterium]|nr:TM0106 family RecB-like putative nuclease [Gammaproteobacteria bacterium]
MRHDGVGVRLSATDLMRFTACPHSVRLDLAYLQGKAPVPVDDSEDSALLQRHGDRHEAEYLQTLEAEHKHVIRIETDGVPFAESVNATRNALGSGSDIVFQGALAGGMWGGYADFLERVPIPSGLGTFSYEVVDTKLKRKPAPSHVLQLSLYSDLLADLQGRAPEYAHVQLGTGERVSFRLSEYSDYVRLLRDRLEGFVQNPPSTRPVPCSLCELCRWREACATEWRETDSLYLTAGITRSQVAKLESFGIRTMGSLAEHSGRVRRLADSTAGKLRSQARLQTARKAGDPAYELRAHVLGKGFDLLPRPDSGDLFYDIEGDPFYAETGSEGLEYLHGIWDGEEFAALWSHNLVEEKKALASLIDRFGERLRQFPRAHIYHYAPYEITALRKLATRHGVGETQLDRWLRERRFVDLYAVVRGGIFASEPSYSLKDMEVFYDMKREGEVVTAGGSIVAYEKWRESGDDGILSEIEEYNRLDCISLEQLRNWLLKIRPEGPWLEIGQGETEKSESQQAQNDELARFLADSDLTQDRQQALYDLGVFHWRESKPQAWAVFDSAAKDFEELSDDMDCLAGLVADGGEYPVKRSVGRDYSYPPQETKLRKGVDALFVDGDGFATVGIIDLDRSRRRVSLKMGPSWGTCMPDALDLLPGFALHPGSIPAAIRRVVDDPCRSTSNTAAEDLRSQNPPRFHGPSPLPLEEGDGTIDGMIRAVRAMDKTVLPVQGPPGTGKTHVTVRTILALVRDGKRIAVSSNSHEAIRNVLMGCARALRTDDTGLSAGDVRITHKISRDTDLPGEVRSAINCVTDNNAPAIETAHVVGGTAWLFSRDELEGAFDYLFVDEAGQVSLANLVAMSNAADNLVLVGDPRQLPQVLQGAHPYPANRSCLDWILGEGRNVDPARGIFLPETWRMHPDLCAYVSSQFYEDRLNSHSSTAFQSIEARNLPRCGAWRVSVAHEGCAQVCPEEVEAVSDTIESLLDGTWTDGKGISRPIQMSDIIVVAPYNAQVNALSDALPGIRVGTVDKFQGQEAPVALVSMTASSSEETTRGLDFLLSRERLNVAVSRGKGLSLVFASPRLMHTNCTTVEQMRLVNALCALPDAFA